MSGDLLIFVASLLGLLAKRLGTPPRWTVTVPDVVEMLVGAACMVVLYALIPKDLFPEALTVNEGRKGLTIGLIGFFAGPGIVTLAKAYLWERLPKAVQGMLPPPNSTPKP